MILLGFSATTHSVSPEQDAKQDRREQAIEAAAGWWSGTGAFPDTGAIDALREVARDGDARAMFLLSRLILRGIESAPVPDQVAEARQLLEASAADGNLDAEVALLFAEAESRDVSNARSDAILKRLVTVARDSRNADAAIALAEIASRGLIGRSGPSEKHADNMYQAAMALGSVQAEYLFAKHKLRWGRLTDWMKHLEQSAAKGHTRAMHEVAIMLMDSDLEEVRKRGAEMLATLARRGYPPAQLELGRILAESPVAEQRAQGAKLIESASRLMQGR